MAFFSLNAKANRKPKGDAGLNENAINTNRSVEHLVALQGRNGSLIYRQMRVDSQVGMILRVHKNPIRSANWTIPEPTDATDAEKKAIALASKWFFEDYTLNFDTLLNQILSCLDYGFSLFERVWKPITFEGTKFLVPTLQQRTQTSIENIFPDKQIVQQLKIQGGLQDIPFQDLVFFTLNQAAEDMRGEAILRNSYDPWRDKKDYRMKMNIGMQRGASGFPSMEIPKNISVEDNEYVAVEELLKNMVQHEDAYMIHPEGYKFTMFTFDFKADIFQKVIDAKNTEMALSVLAQFMLLGQSGKGGAYALSRDQSDFFLDGLQYVVGMIEKCFHRNVLVPFIKLNFGDTVDTSRVKLRGFNLNKKAGEELAKILAMMQKTGFMKPILDDEIQLRKVLEMPDLPPDEIKARREREEKLREQTDPIPPQAPPPKKNKKGEDIDDEEDDDDPTKVDPDNKLKGAIKLAETRIQDRKQFLDKETKEMRDFMEGNLLIIKDKLLADIERTLNQGTTEIRGLKKIEVSSNKYLKGLERKLGGIANGAWNDAKKKAKVNNVKLAEDFDPRQLSDKELAAFILNEAQSTVDAQTSNMKNRAILTASNGPIKGFSINQTMGNVDKVVEKFIKSNSISVGASLIVVGSSNFGENQFNAEIEDQLWGYRFVAVDDGNTTKICLFYNEKTYSVDSTELSIVTPPLHPNCRSFLEPIYKADSEKPEIDDVIAPPTIQKEKTIF